MLNYLLHSFEIVFPRILFIENTEFLISESDTSKTVITSKALLAVPEISTMKNIETKMTIIGLNGSECLIRKFRLDIHI